MTTIFATTNDPNVTTNDDEYTTQGIKEGFRPEMALRVYANKLVSHPRARPRRTVQRVRWRM